MKKQKKEEDRIFILSSFKEIKLIQSQGEINKFL